ncbi:MAG: insulinase family protein [Candidatus Kapabacteria bacterium]|nr:insulinase family protein [Candidatus Kapabacteria bacterium]
MELHRAPLRKELPTLSFPFLRELPAPAGWRCYLLEDTSTTLVVCQLLFPVGSIHAEQPGLARLTLRSLLRGTRRLRAEEFHTRLEAYGATLQISVGREWSSVSCVCLHSVWGEVSRLIQELLAEPALSPEEVLRERQRQVAALLEWCQEPESLARYALFQLWAPGHPYSIPVLGSLPALLELTAEECHRWFESTFRQAVPRFLLMGGMVTEDEVRRWVEQLGGVFAGGGFTPSFPPLPQWEGRRVAVIAKESAVQSALALGLPAPTPAEEAYAAAYTTAAYLGGHFLSRLNRRLREQEGLTYGVSALTRAFRTGGLVLVEGSFALDRAGEVCASILEELEQLRDSCIPVDELQRVVRVIYGSFLRGLVTVQGALGLYATLLIHGLPSDFLQHFLERLRHLQPEELLAVQRHYFAPDRAIIAVSGETEQLSSQLASFGKLYHIPSACDG